MTEAVFYRDAYLTRIDAVVTAVDGEWVEFDRTLFYPMGGGQPGDTGFVTVDGGARHRVIDTRKGSAPGAIAHQLDTTEHKLKVGDSVNLEIDWDRDE